MPYLLLYQLGQLVYLIHEASWLRGPVGLVGGCVWHRLLTDLAWLWTCWLLLLVLPVVAVAMMSTSTYLHGASITS